MRNPLAMMWRGVQRKLFSQMLSFMELHTIKRSFRDDSPQALMKKFTGWVYRAASLNAQTVASVPLRLYAKGGTSIKAYGPMAVSNKAIRFMEQKQQRSIGDATELTEHPLLDLLRLANPMMVGHTLTELTVLYQELVGDAYWYLRPAEGLLTGLPGEVWPLMSHKVSIIPSKTQLVEGYLFGNPGDEESYTPEQVIHFRYPNPNDSLYGMSPLKAALSAVNRATAMDEWQQALYDNNCRPDFVVKVPENTDEGEIEKMYERWDSRFRGTRKSGRPWIATGDASIEMLTFSPKDVNAILHGKFDRDIIFDIFGIPVTMVEVTKSRAEAEAGLYQYMRHTILPRTTRMEQELTEKLCPIYDERLFVSFDNPVPEDEAAKVNKVTALVNAKVMTRNEGREQFGLEQMDGLDEFEQPQPILPPGAEAPIPTKPGEEKPPKPTSSPKESGKEEAAKGGRQESQRPFDHEEKAAPPLTKVETKFKKKVLSVEKREAQFVLDRIEQMSHNGGALVTKDPTAILAGIEKWDEVYASELEDVLMPLLKAGYRAGVRQVVTHAKSMSKALKAIPEEAWTVQNPEVQIWAQTYPRKFGARVNQTFAREITNVVAEGIAASETGREIQARLQETVLGGGRTTARAECIARTESNRAVHGGMIQAWEKSQVVEGKEWLASSDACEFCQEMNGKAVGLDAEYFALGGGMKLDDGKQMRFEYEGVDGPPLHPNCLVGETPVTAPGIVAGLVATYDGPIVELAFADSRRLAVTPNHMLLTPAGFVCASALRQGDQVIDCSGLKRIVGSDPDDNRRPSTVAEIVRSLSEAVRMTATRVPVSPEYLHGDAVHVQGHIDIIAPDGLLTGDGESTLAQELGEGDFGAADSELTELSGDCNLAAVLIALAVSTDRIMCSGGVPRVLEPRTFGHHQPIGVSDAAARNPGHVQNVTDGLPGATRSLGQLLCTLAGTITLANVNSVETKHFSGHVYDLQTVSTLYLANGLVSSNCRCTLLATFKDAASD